LILEIDLRGLAADVQLGEPDDFTSLKVVVADRHPSLQDRVAGLGVAQVDEHAWISTEALRELAGPAATPGWDEAFASMLEIARSDGWLDEEQGLVRAHVERVASP
jgi:hypothetical protein